MSSKLTSRPASVPGAVDVVDPVEVDRIVRMLGRGPGGTVAVLRALQVRYGYLPPAALRRVGDSLEHGPARVAGVASFYSEFRFRPTGKVVVRVCTGTACHVRGAESVGEALRARLGIRPGEDTDPKGSYTVEGVACLGCCSLAPVVRVGEDVLGHLAPHTVGLAVEEAVRDADRPREGDPALAGGAAKVPRAAGEVRVCVCSSCMASGAGPVWEELRGQVGAMAMPVVVRATGCTGMAFRAPLVEVEAGGMVARYGGMRRESVRGLLLRHFWPGTLWKGTVAYAGALLEQVWSDAGWVMPRPEGYMGRWSAARPVAFEHAGLLGPLDLDGYRGAGGFEAMSGCVSGGDRDGAVAALRASGLRGRGGAGYPTGDKWATVRAAPGAEKCVVANGDEGDPGAFMDRALMESAPFRVLEGLLIAAWAVGARDAFVYVRAEYPVATRRMREAARLLLEAGLIGSGEGVPVRLEIVEGAGAFVCGEETALIAALEGKRGVPSYRPPYPSERGWQGRPTLVNNVETLAAVPRILREGPEAFAALGTGRSRGTKAFALAGRVQRGGLVEVPLGTTLRALVEDIGGGAGPGRKVKAVLVGGPSGGCVPEWRLDVPLDYEALAAEGAMMGSGGVVVLDDTDCMVDVARYFVSFTQGESCGKCAPCRVGTLRLRELLERLCQGKGSREDLARIESIARTTARSSLCGLGRTAPNPLLSALRHFREEFEAHLEGRCPAGRCRDLIRYRITDACTGCVLCARACPAGAIAPVPYRVHAVDLAKCTRCDACRMVCPENAVAVE